MPKKYNNGLNLDSFLSLLKLDTSGLFLLAAFFAVVLAVVAIVIIVVI